MGRFLALSALVLLSVPSTLATQAVNYAPISGVSQDGSCGNGVTCVGSAYGNCCNIDGTCGSTEDHCGDGCQPLFGICPAAILNKKYADEAQIERRDLEERAIEARATSLACRSAGTTALTCVASKTKVIRDAGSPTPFCQSWIANKPHPSSPFTAQGILKPIGVSNACSCILGDTSYNAPAPTSLTISLEQKGASAPCVPSKTLVIRAGGTPSAFCKSWLAKRPQPTSPFVDQGILQPVGVDNACSCILADTTYIQTVRPTLPGSTATTAAPVCIPSKTAIIRSAVASVTSFCSSWNANKPQPSSPFTAQGIALPGGVNNACDCILADKNFTQGNAPATTSATTTAAPTTTPRVTTTSSKASTTTSATPSASACTLRKRRRRRDLEHPTSPPREIPTVAW